MKKFLMQGVALAAMAMPAAALAQSTGSIETDDNAIIVTGAKVSDGIEGVVVPDSTKARGVLTQEIISRQAAGQSILNTINLVPGVNFTNSDPYGSSGGNLRIRGFDGNRISLTFDGVPLNDSGNYAIFSNQQLDPELIEQVNVNLGTTDVDSPTASAAGGTVNYRTRLPYDDFGATLSGSVGDFSYFRLFGVVDTGEIGPWGTRAFFSASTARNDKFKGPGGIDKQQYNFRVYQPLGSDGDFVSIAGNYNQNRNNFYRNPSVTDLRGILGSTTVPSAVPSPANPLVIGNYTDLQNSQIYSFDNLATCTRPVPGAGAQNDGATPNATPIFGSTANNPANPSACSNFYGVRVNPSNTGNIRVNSRFTITDKLILTADGAYQYVLAHGGGSTTLAENNAMVKGSNQARAGVDLNGDGDVLDTVRFFTPNITNTNRFTGSVSLIYNMDDDNTFRVAYTYDRARHRQTGEWGYLDQFGFPENQFSGRNGRPVLDGDGNPLQQRDRLSIALLNQVAGQYIGKFFDQALTVELGLRAPFFKRDLDQRCYTNATGSGFAYCSGQAPSTLRIIGATDPLPAVTTPTPYYLPFKAKYKFDKLLPNVGLRYKITDDLSIFGSYAKGFSAPRTDNLYRAPIVTISPETTDAFDLGVRYTTSKLQAMVTGWYIGYQNRIVTSFNQDLGISIDRNVGKVDSYGVDFSLSYQPVDMLTLYGFGSYIHTEIKSNVQIAGTGGLACGNSTTSVPTGCAPTAGKRVPETPEWQLGGRAEVNFGPLSLAGQVKWVDDRFATDVNDVLVKGYTTVDVDARLSLDYLGFEKTYLQMNIINVFDKFYFGNLSTQINNAGNPNFSVGSPRTVMVTLQVGI